MCHGEEDREVQPPGVRRQSLFLLCQKFHTVFISDGRTHNQMFHLLAGNPPISHLYLADTKDEVSIMQRLCTWSWGLLLLLVTPSSHADAFRQAPKAMSALRQGLSLDQILIPCAIKSLAARKPSSLLCRASQPSQRAPQLAIPVRLLSIKPPSLAIAM